MGGKSIVSPIILAHQGPYDVVRSVWWNLDWMICSHVVSLTLSSGDLSNRGVFLLTNSDVNHVQITRIGLVISLIGFWAY